MAAVETFEGTVTWLEKRQASGGTVLEFEVRSHPDSVRRVQGPVDQSEALRVGHLVAVTGTTDANGILVAETVAVRGGRGDESDRPAMSEPVPRAAAVPRWVAYGFPGSALLAILLFVLGLSTDLNRGDGLPTIWAALGTLVLVTTGSGSVTGRRLVPGALLRYTGKAFILIAFVAWWSEGMSRNQYGDDARFAALLVGCLIAALIARLDYRELAALLRSSRMPLGSPASRTRWSAVLAFATIPIVTVTAAMNATRGTAPDAIGSFATSAGALLLLAPLLLRSRRHASTLRMPKALLQFTGSVMILTGLDGYFRIFLLQGGGMGPVAFFALVILLGRLFYARATAGHQVES